MIIMVYSDQLLYDLMLTLIAFYVFLTDSYKTKAMAKVLGTLSISGRCEGFYQMVS